MSHLETAKEAIIEQSEALKILANDIPKDFSNLIDYIMKLEGRVILIGMGKSSYIAKKIAASLASTGTPAFFIHPGEASHGDLGMITEDDMVIMLSNSGETKELFDTVNYCKRYNIKIAAITMKENSTLAQNSNFLLKLPSQKETSSIAAPTTSALMSLSLGDAIVTSLHDAKGFSKEDFKLFHPGGKIGANLLKVSDIMRSGDKLPIVGINDEFKSVILTITEKCLGCAIVGDSQNQMLGIITDGDLRRTIKNDLGNISTGDIMTTKPTSVNTNMLATEALNIMNSKSITALPVIENNKILGIIHIHDILKAGVG
ncbi:MAG: KpsF/GutQ family sugar-phosphate isomerase [Pseudomonadota bacterium]